MYVSLRLLEFPYLLLGVIDCLMGLLMWGYLHVDIEFLKYVFMDNHSFLSLICYVFDLVITLE
jgi:hypothetical protein